MRLLLDHNLSPQLVNLLASAGYVVEHIADHGLYAAPDDQVLSPPSPRGPQTSVRGSSSSWGQRPAMGTQVLASMLPARMAERGARTSARPGTRCKERPICLKGSLQMSRRHEVSGRASWPAAGSGSLPGGGAFDGSPHIGDRPEVIGLASARAAQDPQLLELQ